MGLRIKNFNILGVHWKIQRLGVGSSRKTGIEGRFAQKGRGLGQFAVLRGCFWGRGGGWGWYPKAHYGEVSFAEDQANIFMYQ